MALSPRRTKCLNWNAETNGTSAMTIIRKLLRDDKGIGTIEYALVAMLIGVGALSAYANLGVKVQSHWTATYGAVSSHL